MKPKILNFIKNEVDKIILPKGFKHQRIYDFIYYLTSKSVMIFNLDENKFYINVHNSELDIIFTHKKRTEYLSILKRFNIIDVRTYNDKESYQATKYSKGYKISQELINKMTIINFNEFHYMNITPKVLSILTKKYNKPTNYSALNQYKVMKSKKKSRIDYNKAYKLINKKYDAKEISLAQYNSYLTQLNYINDRNIFVTDPDETNTNRLYHNHGLLERNLRKLYKLSTQTSEDGNIFYPAVSIDLKSAQPYFIATYLVKLDPNIKGYKGYNAFYEKVTGYNYNSNKQIDENADIYNFLLTKCNLTINKTNRDYIKLEFLKYINSTNRGNLRFDLSTGKIDLTKPDLKKVFSFHFPEVHNWLTSFKSKSIDANKKLSIMFQNMEADVFITTANRIFEDNTEHWTINVLTVHDCIYVPNEYIALAEVKSILTEEFNKRNYKHYTLKIED